MKITVSAITNNTFPFSIINNQKRNTLSTLIDFKSIKIVKGLVECYTYTLYRNYYARFNAIANIILLSHVAHCTELQLLRETAKNERVSHG